MKRKQFNALLDLISVKVRGKGKMIDKGLAANLPAKDKEDMVSYLVRNRHPIITELITVDQESWLHSMGYLNGFTNASGYTFLGTSLHEIQNERRSVK